jgi:hypothetical protein
MVFGQGEKLQVPYNTPILKGNPRIEMETFFYCQ